MHILQVLPQLEVGGVERGVLDLAKGLIARGHRVSVVSHGGALVEPLTRLGAMHYRLPVHEKSLGSMLSCVPAVAQLITTTHIDIVHARSRVPAWIGWMAARRTQRPFLTTAHGFYAPHPASRVMVWGRTVIAPSNALGQYLLEEFHLSQERLRIIPRGVDLEQFAFQPPAAEPKAPWRIGLFGRLSRIKGHDVAIRACAQLIARGIPVTLCLAGDAPNAPGRQALEGLIATLRLSKAVQWLGVRQDVAALIASMDIIIAPSTYPESFGRGILEAQAVGRPIVASRLGAFTELIADERTGLLVAPGNPEALARGLEQLIRTPELRARCVEAGRSQVETRYSVDRMVDETLKVYDETLMRPRILIWKLSALGDVVLSTPSLRAIRRQFPKADVTLAVGRAAYPIVGRCPYVNDVLIYDASGKDQGWWRRWAFIRRLRRRAFDLSIDLQNSRATHLMSWAAGIPVRAGYRRKLGWLLNRGVPVPRVVLAPIAHQHYLLRQVGVEPDGDALELWPSALEEQTVEQRLRDAGVDLSRPLIGLHPGGSRRWQTKRWPLERWARLCDAVATHNAQIVMVGGPEERSLGERLAGLTTVPLITMIGQTSVLELACVIKRCRLFIAHDSSSLHLAAAVGTPAIALFGPTDPRRHVAPTLRGEVITHPVWCGPCYATRCKTVTHACMTGISVERVLTVALTMLEDREMAVEDAPVRAGESAHGSP